MNKKRKVNSSEENELPPTIIARSTSTVEIGIAVKVKQERGLCEGQNRSDAFIASTSRFQSASIQTPDLVRWLGYTRWLRASYINENNFCPRSIPGLYEDGTCLRPEAIHSQSTPYFRLVTSRKTISQQPVILMLLYLLSLYIVTTLTGYLSQGCLYSNAHVISDAMDSGTIYRQIRTPKLLTDIEHGNEILVRTTKHGLFRGRILPLDRSPSTRTLPKIGGINDPSVVGFLGIRYASAPIRRLRFMPPTDYHYALNQVHDMQHFGPICRQQFPFDFRHLFESFRRNSETAKGGQQRHSSGAFVQDVLKEVLDLASSSGLSSALELQIYFMEKLLPKESFGYIRPLLMKLARREESEDCLNLNIYAPIEALAPGSGQSSQLKPVLVIIHGESFDFGAGSAISGQKFVQQTRMITITFNYRLNILGFPPKLAGASRGNLGLMDQVAALHWIRENIGSFGGSPNNITLMGTKRGAIFVNLLMLSPLAKGLFQRAIMEDGSALTPTVANHIISPMGSNVSPILNPANSLSLPAIQHVRFLAKLCDCPVYQRTTTKLPTNGSQFTTATSGNDGQQQLLSRIADEIKANALTFECLRHKPIEQIMQPVPLDLLQFNQADGELSIASRWLKPLALVDQFESRSGQNPRLAMQPGDEMIPVDTQVLNKLVLAAAKEQIERDLEKRVESSSEKLQMSGLLGAIYAPPSSSIRPLFGPIEDGSIVPEEDIAIGMLKNGSTFSQRDLLIGLSKPVISSSAIDSPSYDKIADKDPEVDTTSKVGYDHVMADRVTVYMQQAGLTNDQAIGLINLFVRSFYRYHNQEITNSIINHYLSDSGITRARKLSLLKEKSRDNRSDETMEAKINQQQLLVLDSLLEAFQDALINVPVLKTCLIHAIKQLESLVDVFVGQQFNKWKQDRLQSRTFLSQSDSPIRANSNDTLYAFTAFVKSLLNDTSWPLELHSPSNQIVQQPKSTYLYQFDLATLIRRIKRLTSEIASKSSESYAWKRIKESYDSLLSKLQSDDFSRKFGFQCIMPFDPDDDLTNTEVADASDQFIYVRFNDWLCSRYTNILKSFISSGNVIDQHLMGEESRRQIEEVAVPISGRIARFDSECSEYSPQQTGDHHSVQIAGQEIQHSNLSEMCKRELNSIALDLILDEFEPQSGEQDPNWTVFNIFNQQIATLPASRNFWHVGPISDGEWSSQYDQKSAFSARSSFWANYVTALNCTRTQPVIPISLLSSSLANSNASTWLMNLKLVFSCQHGGKTSYDLIESLITSIKQQLEARITQWRLNGSAAGEQNHHSLRMANIGHTNSQDEIFDQQENLNNELSKSSSIGQNESNTLSSGSVDSTNGDAPNTDRARSTLEMRMKHAGILLLICTLVVSITLVSGACVVIRKRKKSRDQNQDKLEVTNGRDVDKQVDQSMRRDSSEQPKGSSTSGDTDNLIASGTHHQDQQAVFVATDIGPMSSVQKRSIDFIVHESPPIQLNEFCTLDNRSGYIYWGNNGQQGMLNGSVPLFRSHSLLNVPINDLPEIACLSNNPMTSQSPIVQSSCLNQEPIMLPIISGSSNYSHQQYHCQQQQQQQPRSSSLRRTGCLANSSSINGFYGDSSSETPDNSKLSVSKKRVKISDPLGTARRTSKTGEVHKTSYCRPPNDRKGSQLRLNDPLYCPVHHDQGIANSMTSRDGDYRHIDRRNYIETKNHWHEGDQTDYMNTDHYVLSSKINDQYTNYDSSGQIVLNDAQQNFAVTTFGKTNYDPNCGQLVMEDEYLSAATSHQFPGHSNS